MYQKQTFFSPGLLESGHTFDANETLLKFQYRVINMILLVTTIFPAIFALMSVLEVNPLGNFHTVVNCLYSLSCIILIVRLRGPKTRYLQSACWLYVASLLTFTSALIFVPSDEFRVIWFYLLVFAAYITGGVRSGDLITAASIVMISLAHNFYELQLSQTAIFSALLGLVIASLLIRSHTKKISDYEDEITLQQHKLTRFNEELEEKVAQKTKELQELNESLESMVAQKVEKITKQEQLMIEQSRFAAMGEMMSMIAHQWRQPLATTTLLITNERLKSMIDGRELREADKILDKISDTMLYLSDTIDDFQTYFKPNKFAEEIDLCVLIERAHNFCESRLKLSKVRLDIKGCDEAFLIETYANEVVQVLINIINNAIDALTENRVEEPNIWVEVSKGDTDIKIAIEDNGGGIGGDIIEKIFEPYFSTKSKNGTGLGLYMAKMIFEKHIKGEIKAKNTQNGACFIVTLPQKSNG